VSRRRQIPLPYPRAGPFLAGVLAVLSAAPAFAQVTNPAAGNAPGSPAFGSDLLTPILDGDPQNPQRFRSPRKAADSAPARFGQLPDFSYRPARGAGTTGFDSTSTRKRKAKPSPSTPSGTTPAGATDAAAQPQDPSAPQTASAPAADAAATPGAPAAPPPLTPKQLQPAGAALPGRIYNQNRPGAPPLTPDGVIATVATTPPSRRQPPELLPFAPLGVQVGAFNIRPAFEYIRGFDSNPARNATGPNQSSWFNLYSPELMANSNWERHELTMSIRGSFSSFDTMHQLDRPALDVRANGRVDVTRDSRIDLEARYILFTDYPGSPNIQAGLSHVPIAMTYGGSAGIGQRFNRFEVIAKSTVERTVYNDSDFTDGETQSNAGRNYNRYASLLRTSYEVTPGIRPFVEAGVDRRQYDLAVDAGGNDRTSQGVYGKAGTTFEATRTLIGEVSFGQLNRFYFDPGLTNIHGLTADASITWLASALTTVKLITATLVTESTLVGVSGAFTRETALQVDHAFRRWLVATFKLVRAIDDYVGSTREDLRYGVSSALAYNITREIVVKGEFRQEWRHSNVPGNDYFANVWLIGLRLQR